MQKPNSEGRFEYDRIILALRNIGKVFAENKPGELNFEAELKIMFLTDEIEEATTERYIIDQVDEIRLQAGITYGKDYEKFNIDGPENPISLFRGACYSIKCYMDVLITGEHPSGSGFLNEDGSFSV